MEKVKVIVNGLFNYWAKEIAIDILSDERYELVDFSLIDSHIGGHISIHSLKGDVTKKIGFIEPELHGEVLDDVNGEGITYAIDLCKEEVAHENILSYCKNRIPFVVSSAEIDLNFVKKISEESKVHCFVHQYTETLKKEISTTGMFNEFGQVDLSKVLKGSLECLVNGKNTKYFNNTADLVDYLKLNKNLQKSL